MRHDPEAVAMGFAIGAAYSWIFCTLGYWHSFGGFFPSWRAKMHRRRLVEKELQAAITKAERR